MISIDFLRANRILMLWDGLDLDGKTGKTGKTGKITDPVLADFYLLLLKGLGRGRAIITCSSLPLEASVLLSPSQELKIASLSETAFIRFLLQDELVADRYRKGVVSFADLQALHSGFLENPAHLAQMRRALRTGLAPGEDALAKLCATLSPAVSPGPFPGGSLRYCHEPGRLCRRWQESQLKRPLTISLSGKAFLWFMGGKVVGGALL